MSKWDRFFELAANALAVIALAAFFLAMAAFIMVEPDVMHYWMREAFR